MEIVPPLWLLHKLPTQGEHDISGEENFAPRRCKLAQACSAQHYSCIKNFMFHPVTFLKERSLTSRFSLTKNHLFVQQDKGHSCVTSGILDNFFLSRDVVVLFQDLAFTFLNLLTC